MAASNSDSVIVDGTSNSQIEREQTKDEIKVSELASAVESERQSDAKAKATAKAALLDKLGITAEEARLLLA